MLFIIKSSLTFFEPFPNFTRSRQILPGQAIIQHENVSRFCAVWLAHSEIGGFNVPMQKADFVNVSYRRQNMFSKAQCS